MAIHIDPDHPEKTDDMETGRVVPALGPSDSSDSASEMPTQAWDPDAATDRQNTGERAGPENRTDDSDAEDIAPDQIVPEDEAGLSKTPPDPQRNGG